MKKYYLFGKDACRIFHETGDVIKVVDDGCEYAIHRFDPEDPVAVDNLLSSYDGWQDYAEITNNQFAELVKHEQE